MRLRGEQGVRVGRAGSREKSRSLRWLLGCCQGSRSGIGAELPKIFLGGRGLAEAWLPTPLWPVLGSDPSTATTYKLCDLQQVPTPL